MTEQSSVNDRERRALDNIPEFTDSQEPARHGAAMFATGIIEGLRQAIDAIEHDRTERQPSRNWPGMQCAIAAIERAIDRQTHR